LQEPALGIAAHRPEREEHREHDAEEERREHREPEDERAREGSRVDPGGRLDVLDVAEGVVVREPVEEEEAGRQHQDDGEDLPPERLPQAVDDDRPDRAQRATSGAVRWKER
jgi:hypothetical protein